jgi:putative lipoprotein
MNHAGRLLVRSIALTALSLAGCAATSVVPEDGGAAPAKVTGIVTYRERIALPPTAVIKVQLVDVSRADAPAVVIGEQVIPAKGMQVPWAFGIGYDPTKIEANHSYAVQARIEDDGQLRFISDQRYAVITRGAPVHVEMVLRSVPTPRR